jgi:hypothetical protein
MFCVDFTKSIRYFTVTVIASNNYKMRVNRQVVNLWGNNTEMKIIFEEILKIVVE